MQQPQQVMFYVQKKLVNNSTS